jgi:hypothetical protein
MKATRLVSLIAASLITAAQWTLFLWILALARIEAAPVASSALDQTMPQIVVTGSQAA